jgi:uncharacterized DUF497 family protein
MEFEYDEGKDLINQAKHGLPLRFASILFEGPVEVYRDERRDYREDRMIAYGYLGGRLCVCVFTDRGIVRRIISLRKANRREQDGYRPR